jgi:hypothetical protein
LKLLCSSTKQFDDFVVSYSKVPDSKLVPDSKVLDNTVPDK